MNINKTKIIDSTLSNYGNGLAASLDVEAGDVVIEIPNPYIVVVEKAYLGRVCSQCLLLDPENLKRCARCKVVQYCSAKCQTDAWSSMHKLECSALSKMPDVPPTPVRALMQILSTHTSGAAADPRWSGLKTNQEYLSKTQRFSDLLLQARAACQYSKFSTPNALELATGVLCRMSTNAFRATSTVNDPIGLCFEPVIALANHSCSPNAAIVFDGRRIMLRALDTIKRDEQIFISYIDGTQRLEGRQAELREAYFFTCKCQKCVEDESPYQSYARAPRSYESNKLDLLLDAKALLETAQNKSSNSHHLTLARNIPGTSYTKVESCLNIARNTANQNIRLNSITQALEILHSFRDDELFALPPYVSILHELFLFYLDAEIFAVALSILLFMQLNCYAFSYAQLNHPSNVERLYMIAKLCALLVPAKHTEETFRIEGTNAGTSQLSKSIAPGPKLTEASSQIDYIFATEALLLLVTDIVPSSHGKNTRFAADVQNQRPDSVGEIVMQWIAGTEQGTAYATKVFESLKRLGGRDIMEEVIDTSSST